MLSDGRLKNTGNLASSMIVDDLNVNSFCLNPTKAEDNAEWRLTQCGNTDGQGKHGARGAESVGEGPSGVR